jgi:hypothetical protein
MTTVIIVGAIVLVVAVGLLVQGEDPVPSEREARSAAVKGQRNGREQAPRSARVEERLQRMREPGSSASEKAPRKGELAGAPRLEDQRVDAQAMLPTARAAAIDDDEDEETDPEDIEDEAKLAETIRSNPDAEERASAIFFLTGGSSRTVVPVLLEALGDPDPEVRLAAVEALDDYAEDLQPETLVPALSDADAEVRFEALGVLGDMEDQDSIRDIAKRMLNDPDDDVRSLAEGILDMEDGA